MPTLLEALEEKYGLGDQSSSGYDETLVSIYVPKLPPRIRSVYISRCATLRDSPFGAVLIVKVCAYNSRLSRIAVSTQFTEKYDVD
jgi:hypothetical protein